MVTAVEIPHPPAGPRFLFYTNECVGLGHLRRTLNLAEAVTRRDREASALVITGSAAILSERRHPRIDTVKLPELSRDRDGGLHAARLGMESDQLHELRSQLALAAACSFDPTVTVVDKTPLGLNDELLPALEALSERGGHRLVLGLRDIEDAPDEVRRRWGGGRLHDEISRLYDTVLVYGPEPVAPDDRESGIDLPIHHVGYVGSPLPARGPADLVPGYLLVTAGGGADGYPVFDAALRAIAAHGAPVPVVVVTGPLMPAAQRAELTSRAAAMGITTFDYRDDMPAVIVGARAVVGMAGYNTVSEVVRARTPMLLLPRTGPSREQLVRATALEDDGAAAMLPLDRATPAALHAAITRLLDGPAPAFDPTSHDGAGRAAAILCALADVAVREAEPPLVALSR